MTTFRLQDRRERESDSRVDQTLRQNFVLQVGGAAETVTVTADAQMVQTDNTTTGNVLDQKSIEELPSSGRDFNNLLELVVGA